MDKPGCSSAVPDELSAISGLVNAVDTSKVEEGVLQEKFEIEKQFYLDKVSSNEKIVNDKEKELKELMQKLKKCSGSYSVVEALERKKSKCTMELSNAQYKLKVAKSNLQKMIKSQNTAGPSKSSKDKNDLIKLGLATPFETARPTVPSNLQPRPRKSVGLTDLFASDIFEKLPGDDGPRKRNPNIVKSKLKRKSNSPTLENSELPTKSRKTDDHEAVTKQKRKANDKNEVKKKTKLRKLTTTNSSVKLLQSSSKDHTSNSHHSATKTIEQVDSDNSDYIPDNDDLSNDDDSVKNDTKTSKTSSRKTKKTKVTSQKRSAFLDDAVASNYKNRMKSHRLQLIERISGGFVEPEEKLVKGEEGVPSLRVPGETWDALFKYQQTGLKWLWQLHQLGVGGILADEMGLGKTVQVIAFFAALRNTKVVDETPFYRYKGLGPVLIVCPATIMQQWVVAFHKWMPKARVAILHQSGTYSGNRTNLLFDMEKTCGVVVTSYERVRRSQDLFKQFRWHYVVLDEGHKIRRHDSGIAKAVKLLQTPHRIILSGSPLQNNLPEIWSLFDFVYPGKLGVLQDFLELFNIPINRSRYSSASDTEVQTGYKVAEMLSETIKPYLLRRKKKDVQDHIRLPSKQDQVLFCTLTDYQVDAYKHLLASEIVQRVFNPRGRNEQAERNNVLTGLTRMREICNHADIYTGGERLKSGHKNMTLCDDDSSYGYWKKSGKMLVVDELLKAWKKQERKVLLFTQSKKMLEVLHRYVRLKGYSFTSMDGETPISQRAKLVKSFNEDSSIFVMIATTTVGGLGLNLTGANRVVIFDPAWNPSTDSQAEERAWRIGQKNPVNIYRLICTGTLEEKIYHRQIHKQFLANQILENPHQRRFFKENDLKELFTLKDQRMESIKDSETSAIFAGTDAVVDVNEICQEQKKKRREERKMRRKAEEEQQQMLLSSPMPITPPSSEDSCSSSKIDLSYQRVLEKFKREKLLQATTAGKKKKQKTYKVDGEVIKSVSKKRTYKLGGGKSDQQQAAETTAADDYILAKLIGKAGVHNVVKHDAIMNSNVTDYSVVETEADRVAKEAVEKLKKRQKYYRNPLKQKPHQRFGATKSMSFKKKAMEESSDSSSEDEGTSKMNLKGGSSGKGASSLLQSMCKRAESSSSDDEDASDPHDASPPRPSIATEDDENLLQKIIVFLKEETPNSSATTDQIITQFKYSTENNKVAIFRALLKRVCHIISNPSGGKIWKLKEEYLN